MITTNEEAIKNLKKLKSFHNGSYGTAINMAIKALEQQPCEDCISRSKALEMLGDEPENWTDTEKEIQEVNDYRWFKSILESLPSVTPKQTMWIPVSERLPLCEQEVLICTQRRSIGGKTKSIITSAIYEDGNMRECYSRWHWEDIEYESWDEEEDCGIIPEGWWEYRHYNPDEVYNNLVDDFILAWMPLPQPYAESDKEEEKNEDNSL